MAWTELGQHLGAVGQAGKDDFCLSGMVYDNATDRGKKHGGTQGV